MERFQAKLKEEVAGDGAMEVMTKKPKGDEVMEVLDAGSEKGRKRRKTKMVTWRLPLHLEERTEKPKGVDEVMKPKDEEAEMLVLDARSKETGGKRTKTKLVTLRSPPDMEDVLINELIDYMLPKPFSTISECSFACVVFDPDLDSEISSYLKEKREYRANVLQQYRTKRYAELQLEVTDDEEELTYELEQELTCELVEA